MQDTKKAKCFGFTKVYFKLNMICNNVQVPQEAIFCHQFSFVNRPVECPQQNLLKVMAYNSPSI